jgi:hypothetical protein
MMAKRKGSNDVPTQRKVKEGSFSKCVPHMKKWRRNRAAVMTSHTIFISQVMRWRLSGTAVMIFTHIVVERSLRKFVPRLLRQRPCRAMLTGFYVMVMDGSSSNVSQQLLTWQLTGSRGADVQAYDGGYRKDEPVVMKM